MILDRFLSLRFSKSPFPVVSPAETIFWIVSCAMNPKLGPFHPPGHFGLFSLIDFTEWNVSLICHNCPPEMVKGSFSEPLSLFLVLTLLLGEMFDVRRNGPHGGKLRRLGRGW
jgi:hypothetical protein